LNACGTPSPAPSDAPPTARDAQIEHPLHPCRTAAASYAVEVEFSYPKYLSTYLLKTLYIS